MATRRKKAVGQTSGQAVTRVIAYVRVSTDTQVEEGVSLDDQRNKLAAYAELYGLTIVEYVADAGVSAATLDRPGLARALTMLAVGDAEGLLVAKLDRLTRSVRDLGELVTGVFAPGRAALLSVGEQIDTRSAGGRLVLNVLASVSQWEREAISERTKSALAHKRRQGQLVGSAPFGMRLSADGVHLETDEQEQAVIARSVALSASGLSLRAIATALTAEGVTGRTGAPLSHVQVDRMLLRVESAAE